MKLNRTVFLFFVGNKNSTVRIVFNYLSKKKKKRRRRSNRATYKIKIMKLEILKKAINEQ